MRGRAARWIGLASFLTVAAVTLFDPASLATAKGPKAQPVRLLVPAYFYPAGDGLRAWERLIASADKVPVVAIVNPDSGPGKSADENYRAIFRLARPSKITLLGYVTLSYGKRPVSAVKADIDSWLYFYPEVDGIFFDEQPSQADQAPSALEGFAYARRKFDAGLLVTNPGTACAREYLAGADGPAACLFEGGEGFNAYRPPDWSEHFGPERFALLLYGVKSADAMRAQFRDAVRKKAGLVYVTDADTTAPWVRLPSYWDDEVAEAAREGP